MSSRCPAAERVLAIRAAAAAGGVLLALAGCHRESRHFEAPPGRDLAPTEIAMSSLVAGQSSEAFRRQQRHEYEENAFNLSEGKRLFEWFNCTGCHSHGGGDSGPALMDDRWIYGAQIDEIYLTIAQGRPNGMPAFAGKIPPQQMWQIAGYVRAMGGHGPKAARPNRDDHIQIPSEQGRKDEPVKPAASSVTETG
jgi:cytochrome c oxidase cbb3-type subunit III